MKEPKRAISLLLSTMVVTCGCGILANKQTASDGAAITLVPSSGKGHTAVVTLKLDPAGIVGEIGVLYNRTKDGRSACYIFYNPARNDFSLVKDSGFGADPLIAGESLVENSQCTLAGAGKTRAETKNNALVLYLEITFKSEFSGPKNVYVYVTYKDGRKPSFEQEGTWLTSSGAVAPSGAVAVTLAPSSGEGQSAVFTVNLHPAEAVLSVSVLYNDRLTGIKGCYVSYNLDDNSFRLANDSADSFELLAGGKKLENGQCTLDGAGMRGEIKNRVLALSLPITFKPAFAGPRNAYVYVEYKGGREPTFEQEGTWLVAR